MFGGIFGRQQPRPDPQTSPEVAAALVRADETVRRGTDELGYATAQFGDAATRDLAVALDQARVRLQEAFRLNGLLLDDDPETPEESRSLETAVLAATVEIERLLRPPVEAFAARRAALQEAPTAIARLRAEVTDIRGRVCGRPHRRRRPSAAATATTPSSPSTTTRTRPRRCSGSASAASRSPSADTAPAGARRRSRRSRSPRTACGVPRTCSMP